MVLERISGEAATSGEPVFGHVNGQNLRELALDEVVRSQVAGASVLDARDSDAYATAHLAGAINIGLSEEFASWAGTILRRGRPVVLISDPAQAPEAAARLGGIGFDMVLGFYSGGFTPNPHVRRMTRVDPRTLFSKLTHGIPPAVLDVRTRREWRVKRLDGSVNVPLGDLAERYGPISEIAVGYAGVLRRQTIVVHCDSGYRSSAAASILENEGFTDVHDLRGGLTAWEAAGLPIVGEGTD
jgi:hydroxyacylglutathione hydrolase